MFPRARDIKERINKWNFTKLKSFYTAKKISAKWKGNKSYGKIYFPTIPQTKVWSPEYIKNSRLRTRKKNNPIKKWAKDLNRHFSKEDIQRTQRHMKGCSASLAIREMQIKTMRYHFTPMRMAMINKPTKNKCWRGWESCNTNSKEPMYPNVHSSTTYNSQELETAYMPISKLNK